MLMFALGFTRFGGVRNIVFVNAQGKEINGHPNALLKNGRVMLSRENPTQTDYVQLTGKAANSYLQATHYNHTAPLLEPDPIAERQRQEKESRQAQRNGRDPNYTSYGLHAVGEKMQSLKDNILNSAKADAKTLYAVVSRGQDYYSTVVTLKRKRPKAIPEYC